MVRFALLLVFVPSIASAGIGGVISDISPTGFPVPDCNDEIHVSAKFDMSVTVPTGSHYFKCYIESRYTEGTNNLLDYSVSSTEYLVSSGGQKSITLSFSYDFANRYGDHKITCKIEAKPAGGNYTVISQDTDTYFINIFSRTTEKKNKASSKNNEDLKKATRKLLEVRPAQPGRKSAGRGGVIEHNGPTDSGKRRELGKKPSRKSSGRGRVIEHQPSKPKPTKRSRPSGRGGVIENVPTRPKESHSKATRPSSGRGGVTENSK